MSLMPPLLAVGFPATGLTRFSLTPQADSSAINGALNLTLPPLGIALAGAYTAPSAPPTAYATEWDGDTVGAIPTDWELLGWSTGNGNAFRVAEDVTYGRVLRTPVQGGGQGIGLRLKDTATATAYHDSYCEFLISAATATSTLALALMARSLAGTTYATREGYTLGVRRSAGGILDFTLNRMKGGTVTGLTSGSAAATNPATTSNPWWAVATRMAMRLHITADALPTLTGRIWKVAEGEGTAKVITFTETDPAVVLANGRPGLYTTTNEGTVDVVRYALDYGSGIAA